MTTQCSRKDIVSEVTKITRFGERVSPHHMVRRPPGHRRTSRNHAGSGEALAFRLPFAKIGTFSLSPVPFLGSSDRQRFWPQNWWRGIFSGRESRGPKLPGTSRKVVELSRMHFIDPLRNLSSGARRTTCKPSSSAAGGVGTIQNPFLTCSRRDEIGARGRQSSVGFGLAKVSLGFRRSIS